MKDFALFVWRKHRLAGIGLAAAVLVFGFFLASFAGDALYFSNPANQNRPLELWMSPRYVGQSWDLPRPVIMDIMGLDRHPEGGPPTLADVLEDTGMTLDELQARVEAARQEMQGRRGK